MAYTNPGELFVKKFGPVNSSENVIHYVNFLREEACLGPEPPIALERIYARFEMPPPKLAPLPNLQGLLLNPEKGLVLINVDDPVTRRRFSEAHELIEFLFDTLPRHRGRDGIQKVGSFESSTKERLCNEGAAELVMPTVSFVPRVQKLTVSFQTARLLAPEFAVSMTAALVHMASVGPGRHAVVMWRLKNKPTEIQDKISEQQLPLFGETSPKMPPKKLRVEWALSRRAIPYIPPNKSVPEDSSIYRAWQEQKFTIGEDRLVLGRISGLCLCENQPFEVDGEWMVLSLLHLPGDE